MATLILPFARFRMWPTKKLQPFGPLMLGDRHDRPRDRRGVKQERLLLLAARITKKHQTILCLREEYWGVIGDILVQNISKL